MIMQYVYITDDGMFLDHPAYDMEESKTMTVGELIEVLKQYPKDAPVFHIYHGGFREIKDFCIGIDSNE